jgi:hypothetical protein
MMKPLKWLLVLMVICTMIVSSQAQNLSITGGLNLSNQMIKYDGQTLSDDFKMLPGFHAGAFTSIPLSGTLTFDPGLLITTEGFRYNFNLSFLGENFRVKSKVNLIYLDVPLNLKNTFDLGGANLYIQAGPYAGIGLSGKIKTEMTYNGETEKETVDVEWGNSSDDQYRRLDFGLGAGAGIGLGNMSFGVSYNLGLANTASSNEGGGTIKNRVLGISLAYRIL